MQNIKAFFFGFTFLIIVCCNKKENFDNSFLQNHSKVMPELIITSNNDFNDLLLTGNFGYYLKGYKVKKQLLIIDSSYVYSQNSDKNIFLFDFSSEKKNGTLKINDTLNLSTIFFMDMKYDNKNFRLFKIINIDNYGTLNLSRIYITNYNYGILGELLVGKENNQWFVFDAKGYIPNKDYIYSKFKSAKLQ